MFRLAVLFFSLSLALNVQQSATNPYVLSNLQTSPTGLTATLAYSMPNPSSAVIQNLLLNITYVSESSLRVRITNANTQRWEVPINLMPYDSPTSGLNYNVTANPGTFNLQVTRVSDGKVVFNIDQNTQFQFNDQDIIWTNNLGYPIYTYGLGERTSTFRLQPGIYTIFTRDNMTYDNGSGMAAQTYGHHPFYLALDTSSGNTFGGFLLNSNAMDVTVASQSIKYETIGGIIDFFVFVGPTPISVVQQYNALLGSPVLVPYWGLGWHQCRWGYHDLTDLQTVVQNYQANVIPLDVMWTDIDYMVNFYDFTLDTSRYPSPAFQNWISSLHSQNMHFIPIVDAGIAAQNYFAYNAGLSPNIFITAPNSNSPFIGQVWPGNATWVDWFNPGAQSYWWNQLDTLKQSVNYDGVWLDMNEASDFCYGECSAMPAINLPYTPGQTNPNTKAIDLMAGHYGGILEYNAHSLFGFMESRATSQYFSQHLNQRPFIISRSSFPTHGRYASRWLGDNESTWGWMNWSIGGVFNFQMFGIPVIGADVCGFNGNTTPELCSRWTQLGTLYPFSRNHNSQDQISQEPYALGPQVLENNILGIRNKYSLLNYFYTLMYQASISPVGGMIWKPTFFNYPTDSNLWDDAQHAVDNFMIGDALIVHPCLTQGATNVTAYFPLDTWYNWYTGHLLPLPSNNVVTLLAPLIGLINIHIRGGYIVPRLDASSSANTVQDLRSSNTTLVVALNSQGIATGEVIYDDGLSANSITNNAYVIVQYQYEQVGSLGTFTIASASKYTLAVGEFPYISMLLIYGCPSQPTGATQFGAALTVTTGYDAKLGHCWLYFDDQVETATATTIKISF